MKKDNRLNFDWKYYLILSELLLDEVAKLPISDGRMEENKRQEKESKCRCGISRAYYSAFHMAKNYLIEQGEALGSSFQTSHQEVIDKFIHSKNSEWKKIGINLDMLRGHRVRADYYKIYVKDQVVSTGDLISNLRSNVRISKKIFKIVNELKSH